MKALRLSSSQLELVISRDPALTVADRDVRSEVVRALAEILLIAADATAGHVRAALAEEDHETP